MDEYTKSAQEKQEKQIIIRTLDNMAIMLGLINKHIRGRENGSVIFEIKPYLKSIEEDVNWLKQETEITIDWKLLESIDTSPISLNYCSDYNKSIIHHMVKIGYLYVENTVVRLTVYGKDELEKYKNV